MEKITKLKLKEITLKNYKGLKERTIPFAQRTYILGKNAVGKTTIMDAYFDVLTGKTADGKTTSNIRPHDTNGVDIDRIPVERAFSAVIAGKNTDLLKVTEQKWKKPRGQEEEVFSGNETTYKINGFDKKAKDYDEYISTELADAETLLMCSNAAPFLNILQKSTTDARKLLEKLSGFKIEDFIAKNPQFADIAEITQGNSIEDTIKQLKRNLSAQKKEVERKRTELSYETDRDSGNEGNIKAFDEEYAELEAKLTEVQKQLASIDKSAYEAILKQIADCNDSKQAYISEESKDFYKAKEKLQSAKAELEAQEAQISQEIQSINFTIENIDHKRNDTRSMIISLQREYEVTGEKLILEATCPYCGQELPEEKKASIAEKNAEITASLKELGQRIEDLEKYLKTSLEERSIQETLLADKRKEKSAFTVRIYDADNAIKAKGNAPDFTHDIIYQQIDKKEQELRHQLTEYATTKDAEDILRSTEAELTNKMGVNRAGKKQAEEFIADKESRLEKLSESLKNEAQRCADIERQIDRVLNFSIEKNKALANTINPHFKHFYFEFLEYTQEGNPVETCKLVHDGTSYFDGLNGGDKKLVEIYLVAGLQDLNHLCLPIWVDEASLIDPWRIPDGLEQQLIVIQRSDDTDIVVKGEN